MKFNYSFSSPVSLQSLLMTLTSITTVTNDAEISISAHLPSVLNKLVPL